MTIELDDIIDFLEDLRKEHPYRVQGDYDTYGQFNMAWDHCIDRVLDWAEAQQGPEYIERERQKTKEAYDQIITELEEFERTAFPDEEEERGQ